MSRTPFSFTLTAHGVTFARGGRPVLDRVDLAVTPGARVGVVGPNGVGKSTLLRILAGEEQPDAGVVRSRPTDLRVAHLSQEHHLAPGTVRDLLARTSGVGDAATRLADASAAVAGAVPGAGDQYAAALNAFLAVGAPDFDARVQSILDEVGLPAQLLDRPVGDLSGGEAARAALASVLLLRADVVLLDEPTNDLDFDGLARLEHFVMTRPGGTVVVSHDRAFLERTVTEVVELDEHTHRSSAYRGGWRAYLDERAVARRQAEERYEAHGAARARLVRRAQRQRRWATQGVRRAKREADEPDKNIRRARVATSEQLAAKARASERALSRLAPVDKPWEGWDLRFRVATAPRSGAVAFRLTDAVIERGKVRLGPLNVEVRWADRIAIIGPNGAGKTSLLQALLGELPLTRGSRWTGPSVIVGDLDQRRARFTGDDAVLEAIEAPDGRIEADVRSQLAKFGLGADQLRQATRTLSPGERTRAILAEFALRGVNCLVLDEPSNQLDLPAIEELETALAEYPGTLLMVSHDRELLDHVTTTRRWSIHDGTIDES